MITEHALLPVTPGREADFQEKFASARQLIASMPGFRSVHLSRCVERPNVYLLLVEWENLTDRQPRNVLQSDCYSDHSAGRNGGRLRCDVLSPAAGRTGK